MSHHSSNKKSEETMSELTDQVVFKGGIFSSNLTNMTHKIKNQKSPRSHSQNIIQVKSQTIENLSFRTTDEKNQKNHFKDPIENLCERVTDVLKNHKIKDNTQLKYTINEEFDKEANFKKLFKKKSEKELEVFESERISHKDNSVHLDSAKFSNNSMKYNGNKNPNINTKYLNKVVCTLSKNENGFATFVSKDDLIFVLPSLFIPSNLNIGSTYVFKLAEVDQAENKIDKVNAIHQYYAQDHN